MSTLTKEELLARANKPAQDAMHLHPFYRGKIEVVPKCAVRGMDDFAIWYTPGVAAPCRDIAAHPERVYDHTNKANTIAVVSDGTRVLGLGDIGPEAGLPVMEGKALIFKYLGGVDAVPICLDTKNPDEIIQAVKWLQPSFGGINLEDISQPKCFRVLDTLRAEMSIPVWHDDQQGTATVLLAGLINALHIVGKRMEDVRIAMIGMGAANVATVRLLRASGVPLGHIIATDSRGILHLDRDDVRARQTEFPDKWRLCQESNEEARRGDIAEAMRGADVMIAFSQPGPDVIKPAWVAGMAPDAIVFPCANPIPEIWPWEALEAGARIVGTGRSDFPNQLNNSLGFPGIFRGTLDVRASTITDEMCLAAAHELAACARERGIDENNIAPTMDEWEVFPREATAVGMKAIEQGIAGIVMTRDELYARAEATIRRAREETKCLMREGYIAPVPEVV
ncbi:MAG: NADP-dependent malic enzyme [Chloroflexi bacterium]|nr:NADP-dependent malic enzyme [Chloroflexota bacterium]MBU1750829.1 NADP-dependent malic enzyme [Chloroflexota bacterium]MBU1878042.1 NADP-dependent malic enzyme [Chloroflexota bacterium]